MSANIVQPRRGHAPAPFNKPAADIVLRSSDGTDFRVHSVMVAEASEVLAGIFANPQPPQGASGVDNSADSVGDTPIFQLAEDARTLDALLRLCYPVKDPAVDDPQHLRKVLAAAIKYAMEEAVALMRTQLRALIRMDPFQGWMLACALKLDEDAQRAALTLRWAVLPFDTHAALLRTISAGQYYRLRLFMSRNMPVGTPFSFTDVNRNGWGPVNPPRESLEQSPLTFQERPFADVICRASDGAAVLSHKAVLAAASPVLRDRLLALVAGGAGPDTQTPSTAAGAPSFPVLQFPDMSGTTLPVLLELCYPVPRDESSLPSFLGPMPALCALVGAATRHAIGRVCDMLQRALLARIPGAPLTAYLLAAHAKLGAVYVRSAEQHILRGGRPPSAYGWLPEMERVDALAYHLLVAKYEDLRVTVVPRSGLPEHAACGPTAPCRRRLTSGRF